MATRKKAAVLEPPQAPAPFILPDLVAGTLTEAGYVPRGNIERVKIPVYPELDDLYVLIDTSVAWGISRGNYTGRGETPIEREARKAAAYIVGFEGWRFVSRLTGEPIPVPDPAEPESYYPFMRWNGELTAIYIWIIRYGIDQACNQAMGNSPRA